MRDRARAIAAVALLLATLAATLSAKSAAAHTRSMSYSTWTLNDDGAHVELRLKLIELTREPPDHPWATSLPAELTLEAGAQPCHAGSATRARTAPEGWAIFRWRIQCAQDGARVIRSNLLRGAAANHANFVRVRAGGGQHPIGRREHVLTTGDDEALALDSTTDSGVAGEDGSPAPTSVANFVALGAAHIASGWDHLAFVFALLLLATGFREVAILVTSFTVAHSATLALAVLGVVRPEEIGVEVAIAFSIALVAAENGWLLAGRDPMVQRACVGALLVVTLAAAGGMSAIGPLSWLGLALFTTCHFELLRRSERPARLRAALAFAFGLLHGFGFAGALMELELAGNQLASALFGFNVGVELGQLLVVAIVWPLLTMLARYAPAGSRLVSEAASAAVLALGLFFLAERAF
jgi:hypothetical protein